MKIEKSFYRTNELQKILYAKLIPFSLDSLKLVLRLHCLVCNGVGQESGASR